MNDFIKNRIAIRAKEIYEFHRDTGTNLIFDNGRLRERTDQDNWLEAEFEIMEEIRRVG